VPTPPAATSGECPLPHKKHYSFPTQIDGVENFKFLVSHSAPAPGGSVIAQAILDSQARSPVYKCTDRAASGGLETECDIVEGPDVIAQPVNQEAGTRALSRRG
jgi:hypothetical protein